jgi:5-methylcytosine-specific restriction endonuclease McrA
MNTKTRDYLKEFWDMFGGVKNDGWGIPRDKKVQALAAMSMVRVEKIDHKERVNRREEFWKVRNDRHSLKQYPRCFCCSKGNPVTRHHIIQLKNGGPNSGRNIVSLCNSCNKRIHPWLTATA